MRMDGESLDDFGSEQRRRKNIKNKKLIKSQFPSCSYSFRLVSKKNPPGWKERGGLDGVEDWEGAMMDGMW